MVKIIKSSNVSLHINNIYNEGELSRQSTVKKFLTVKIYYLSYCQIHCQLT